MNPGGLPKNTKKVNERACMQKVYDRTEQPVVYRSLGKKTSDERPSRIYFIVLYFVADRSFTADGGLLKPTGGVKTTPQKTRFRSVNN